MELKDVIQTLQDANKLIDDAYKMKKGKTVYKNGKYVEDKSTREHTLDFNEVNTIANNMKDLINNYLYKAIKNEKDPETARAEVEKMIKHLEDLQKLTFKANDTESKNAIKAVLDELNPAKGQLTKRKDAIEQIQKTNTFEDNKATAYMEDYKKIEETRKASLETESNEIMATINSGIRVKNYFGKTLDKYKGALEHQQSLDEIKTMYTELEQAISDEKSETDIQKKGLLNTKIQKMKLDIDKAKAEFMKRNGYSAVDFPKYDDKSADIQTKLNAIENTVKSEITAIQNGYTTQINAIKNNPTARDQIRQYLTQIGEFDLVTRWNNGAGNITIDEMLANTIDKKSELESEKLAKDKQIQKIEQKIQFLDGKVNAFNDSSDKMKNGIGSMDENTYMSTTEAKNKVSQKTTDYLTTNNLPARIEDGIDRKSLRKALETEVYPKGHGFGNWVKRNWNMLRINRKRAYNKVRNAYSTKATSDVKKQFNDDKKALSDGFTQMKQEGRKFYETWIQQKKSNVLGGKHENANTKDTDKWIEDEMNR